MQPNQRDATYRFDVYDHTEWQCVLGNVRDGIEQQRLGDGFFTGGGGGECVDGNLWSEHDGSTGRTTATITATLNGVSKTATVTLLPPAPTPTNLTCNPTSVTPPHRFDLYDPVERQCDRRRRT